MLKEIDSMFDMNSLAFLFSEHTLNLKMVILTSFFLWCFDVRFKFHNGVLIQVLISYIHILHILTIRDSCMKFSAFVQRSLIYIMYVKTENHILCH